MTVSRSRAGFTMTELMIASTIMVIVMCSIGSTFMFCHRIMKTVTAETELSLGTRELRDKLLFKVAPYHDGIYYAGLLSATSKTARAAIESDACIMMYSPAYRASDGVMQSQDQRIIMWSDQGGYYLFNDRDRKNVRWLKPTTTHLISENGGNMSSILDDSDLAIKNRFYFDVIMTVNGERRGERITVPLFGRIQPTED